MRILVVHNRYRHSGGEDRLVDEECTLLSTHGHEVARLTADNDSILGPISTIKVAGSAAYSAKSRDLCRDAIHSAEPQIAHVHNLFPLLTPSVLDACLSESVPVVMTLHNYRLFCAGALFARNGSICTKCVASSPYVAVLHRCYRNSFLGSMAAAHVVSLHQKRHTWTDKVARYIATTEFGRRLFVELGLPEGKVCVKPNFVREPALRRAATRRGALFVGRLSAEKGVRTLLEAWRTVSGSLVLAGSGPQDIVGRTSTNVHELGHLPQADVARRMSEAEFLVVPSEWFEGFPMVIIEAFAMGLPVLASRIGAMAEIVQDGVSGLHFEPGSHLDLAMKANWMFDHPEECLRMGLNARADYDRKYGPKHSLDLLMDIYRQAREETPGKHGVDQSP